MTTLSEAMTALGRSRMGVHLQSETECLIAIAGTPSPWRVAFRLQREHRHAPWSITESSVAVRGKGVNMNGNDIRNIPWGELMARARKAATEAVSVDTQRAEKTLTRPSEVNLGAFASRGAKTDRDYALLALQYVQVLQDGDRKPSEALARLAGFGTPGTWTNRIVEARKRGLLTPGKRGEAGGSLMPKAERLLSGAE